MRLKKGFEMRKRWWEVKVFKEAKHKVFDYKVKIIEVSMFAGLGCFEPISLFAYD